MTNVQLHCGDCLEVMPSIPDGSVDLILADVPYGTTACKWDSVIDLDLMWSQLKRIIKPKGAIVMTAAQPFTSALVMSNPSWFKYDLVWDKVNLYTNFLNSAHQPLRRHESVLVFYKSKPTYVKQWRSGQAYQSNKPSGFGDAYGSQRPHHSSNDGKHHNPCSVIQIKSDIKSEKGLHPTQKPLALMDYLIKTYTNEGQSVLDFTMGSGTTGVACVNTNRNFIGIEMDQGYFDIAQKRIAEAGERLAA